MRFIRKMGDLDHSSNDTKTCKENNKESNARTEESKIEFSEDEKTLIDRMYNLVPERWSIIAGRIPGRTAEEIEKYWTSRNSSSTK